MNHLLRTMPPPEVQPLARSHDCDILNTFTTVFALPSEEHWDAALHGIQYIVWVAQARLPLRLAGMGLRDSQRTSIAAYWASWADALPDLVARFPALGRRALHHFTTC